MTSEEQQQLELALEEINPTLRASIIGLIDAAILVDTECDGAVGFGANEDACLNTLRKNIENVRGTLDWMEK